MWRCFGRGFGVFLKGGGWEGGGGGGGWGAFATELGLGVAQVQTKKFDDAIRNLSGLNDAEALRWLAKAHVGIGVTPVQLRQNGAGILPTPQERQAGLELAIAAMKKAVELTKTARQSS